MAPPRRDQPESSSAAASRQSRAAAQPSANAPRRRSQRRNRSPPPEPQPLSPPVERTGMADHRFFPSHPVTIVEHGLNFYFVYVRLPGNTRELRLRWRRIRGGTGMEVQGQVVGGGGLPVLRAGAGRVVHGGGEFGLVFSLPEAVGRPALRDVDHDSGVVMFVCYRLLPPGYGPHHVAGENDSDHYGQQDLGGGDESD